MGERRPGRWSARASPLLVGPRALALKTNSAPAAKSTALQVNATLLPKAVHSTPTMTLERKSPVPFTVASVPKATPWYASSTSSAQ
ncbi:MAG: hypothetical protein M3463_18805 [Verrucomicrobiota bacterium]|nr:hypothetical protein [Verrucomicrobiota bacterium]